jgi:hypothetical protein
MTAKRKKKPDGPRPAPAKPTRAPLRRRDGSGHLDPTYRRGLLARSAGNPEPEGQRAFFDEPRSGDTLAEQLGEEFIEAATSGQDEGDERFDQVVPEENGGPFIETSANTEFAGGTDESNIEEATKAPFPTT